MCFLPITITMIIQTQIRDTILTGIIVYIEILEVTSLKSSRLKKPRKINTPKN